VSLYDWELDRIRGEFPLWSIGPDHDEITAISQDGRASVTARSVAELRVLLENEWWKTPGPWSASPAGPSAKATDPGAGA